MDTVQSRLRFFREKVAGLSLRGFRERVNRELPPRARLSLGTLSNYERAVDGVRRPGPRTDFVAALKRAFPEIRLEWIVLGQGQPTALAQGLAAPEGLEAKIEADAGGNSDDPPGARSRLAARVLERYPDLELLSPEASAVFMAALTRLAMGEPDMALDEAHLLELAGDLRWLMLGPLEAWGFRHDPAYRAFSDYAVAMLHALMQLMPDTGSGDPISTYPSSMVPRLRRLQAVGF